MQQGIPVESHHERTQTTCKDTFNRKRSTKRMSKSNDSNAFNCKLELNHENAPIRKAKLCNSNMNFGSKHQTCAKHVIPSLANSDMGNKTTV